MKQPHTTTARMPLLAALAVAAALTACGRQADDMTAGQRVDEAIADTKQAGTEARRDAQQAMVDAQMSASQAAESTAKATLDMSITAKVNAALVADDQLKATQINVDTRDGQVTLSGEAPDARLRERATTLASAVDGVKQVNNQLIVTRNG